MGSILLEGAIDPLNFINIQTNDFDAGFEQKRLLESSPKVGAVVCFTGLVRDFEAQAPIDALSIQHYPGMTEKLLKEIVSQANERWDLLGMTVIHRIGSLRPTEQIVLVAVAAQRRAPAFEAAQFVMDYLKTRATLWKRVSQGEKRRWLEQKQSDTDAAARWDRARD